MTDDEVRTIEQLLQKQTSDIQETVGDQLKVLTKRVDDGFKATATITQIDAIAKHLAETKQSLARIETVQAEHSDSLDKIDRTLSKHMDRLDEHGERIEVLEKKTAHLPTPSTR